MADGRLKGFLPTVSQGLGIASRSGELLLPVINFAGAARSGRNDSPKNLMSSVIHSTNQ
jgi:hypothetical protein